MGLADAFILMRFSIESVEAEWLNKQIFETNCSVLELIIEFFEKEVI